MNGANQKKDSCLRVVDFYDGKSVFLTGAAGYLGVILLETLLELCPGIKTIYILLRERKGIQPEKRKDEIFSRIVFDKVKKEMPEVLEKVQVVSGDVSKPNMGMNEEDLQKVVENVNIVFHCAASVNFMKPLKYILQHNSLGTQYAIDLCRKLKQLDAFVYTSSAYSNSNRSPKTQIQETIYGIPFPVQTILNEISEGTDESLERLISKCHSPWPNSYTFSKCLAENILHDNAADLPVIIIRPSIIGPVWKRPLPGYIEETSGITALSIGVGKGFLKLLKGNPGNIFDFITVDLCTSAHVIAAWSVGTKRSPPLHVVHCTSSLRISLRDYGDMMLKLVKRKPLPKTFRKPTTLKIIQNTALYWAVAYYEHYIPAYIFDVFLKLSGSKIRLIRIYQYAEKAIQSTTYFMSNYWTFHTENFHGLLKQVQVEERKKFEVEETVSEANMLTENIVQGALFWQWSSDKKNMSDRMKVATQRYWITNGIKTVVIVCMAAILYLIFTVTLQLFK